MQPIEGLIGREQEREDLERCHNSRCSEFIAVYGRRRIGKTFLIEQHFNRKFDFWYVGKRNVSNAEQLRQFKKSLIKHSGNKNIDFSNWFEAFEVLADYLESLPSDYKKVVFIDEMPWIDKVHSNFVSALEGFWNGWAASRRDIMLIATGSATSWMRDKLLGNKGGLHNRVSCHLHISPFTLKETELYLQLNNIYWDRYQILQSYMVMGGVPFYYSLLVPELSLSQNIDRLFFKTDGKLRVEFDELYNALFRNADSYIKVVKALSTKKSGMTNKEISKVVNIEGSQLTRILKNLERCDFIERWTQYGNKKRDELFRLIDFYTIFYYKFIDSDNSREEKWWTKNSSSPSVMSWMGNTFEIVCLRHHEEIKRSMGLEVISTSMSSWHCRPNEEEGLSGAQIDMVIERADRIIHLCEIKFSLDQYILSKDYEKKLRERMSLFRHYTKCNKSIVHTMITTYGVANGKNKSIIHSEVRMDDLFDR